MTHQDLRAFKYSGPKPQELPSRAPAREDTNDSPLSSARKEQIGRGTYPPGRSAGHPGKPTDPGDDDPDPLAIVADGGRPAAFDDVELTIRTKRINVAGLIPTLGLGLEAADEVNPFGGEAIEVIGLILQELETEYPQEDRHQDLVDGFVHVAQHGGVPSVIDVEIETLEDPDPATIDDDPDDPPSEEVDVPLTDGGVDVELDYVLIAGKRSRTSVYHLPHPDDPSEPQCNHGTEASGRYPDHTGFSPVNRDDSVLEDKTLCKFCDPDEEIRARGGGLHNRAKLAKTDWEDLDIATDGGREEPRVPCGRRSCDAAATVTYSTERGGRRTRCELHALADGVDGIGDQRAVDILAEISLDDLVDRVETADGTHAPTVLSRIDGLGPTTAATIAKNIDESSVADSIRSQASSEEADA